MKFLLIALVVYSVISSSYSSASSPASSFKEDDCWVSVEEAPTCAEAYQGYFFDAASRSCSITKYGGCKPTKNMFKTYDECDQIARTVCRPALTKAIVPQVTAALSPAAEKEAVVSPPASKVVVSSKTSEVVVSTPGISKKMLLSGSAGTVALAGSPTIAAPASSLLLKGPVAPLALAGAAGPLAFAGPSSRLIFGRPASLDLSRLARSAALSPQAAILTSAAYPWSYGYPINQMWNRAVVSSPSSEVVVSSPGVSEKLILSGPAKSVPTKASVSSIVLAKPANVASTASLKGKAVVAGPATKANPAATMTGPATIIGPTTISGSAAYPGSYDSPFNKIWNSASGVVASSPLVSEKLMLSGPARSIVAPADLAGPGAIAVPATIGTSATYPWSYGSFLNRFSNPVRQRPSLSSY